MIKTLIADDNVLYIKKLMNNIINKISDIKVEYISTDGKETLDIISNNNFDLILLDLQMPNLNGFEVIEEIKKSNFIKIPKIIIISGDLQLIKYAKVSGIVYDVIPKYDKDEEIYRKILYAISEINYNENYDKVKKKTIITLTNMGYNLKHKGTKYIIEAIMYLYENNDYNILDNLEKNVYGFVAYRHNKTIDNIKSNIAKSTKNIEKDKVHLSPKEVITEILVNL